MKSVLVALLIASGLAAVLPGQPARAAAVRLPASVYPAGAHIGFRPLLSNAEMDCLWGFVCEGGNISNFHLTPQDRLHRLGGWAQFAGIQQYGRMTMAFQLFASSYDPAPGETGTPWSEWAFRDLALALHAQGYSFDRRHAGLIVSGHEGGRLLAVQPLGAQDLVVMAGWSGSFEVEGIALYRHGSRAAKHTAWTSLALQLHLAWDRMA